jgi:flagellar protein FlaG
LGFGTTATHIIFFIISVILAASVGSALLVTTQGVMGSITEKSKILSYKLETEITIINDPAATSNVFYVKNTGKSEIPPDPIDVIIDGEYIDPSNVSVSVIGGGVTAKPGDVIKIVVSGAPTTSGDHTVKIVVYGGVSDIFEYTI